VAPGSAVPEFAGGGFVGAVDCVPLSAGGVPVVSPGGGVAVVSFGGGAVCSAGGNEFWDGDVPADCCFEHAESSRSAPTLTKNAIRFIRVTSLFGLRFPANGGSTGRSVLTRTLDNRSDEAIGVSGEQAHLKLSATLLDAQAWL
jgi:hypothetical protein